MSTASLFPISYYQINVAKPGQLLTLFLIYLAAPALAEKAALPNFHVVHNYLLRGGQPTEPGLKTLKDLGVEVVVNLQAPTIAEKHEAAYIGTLGMKYINLPMSSRAPSERAITTFLDTIDKQAKLSTVVSSSNPGVKYPHAVFVHCAHGSDRTGAMIGIWRVSRDGWTYPQAYKEMRRYYFGPQFKELSQAVKQQAMHSAQ